MNARLMTVASRTVLMLWCAEQRSAADLGEAVRATSSRVRGRPRAEQPAMLECEAVAPAFRSKDAPVKVDCLRATGLVIDESAQVSHPPADMGADHG